MNSNATSSAPTAKPDPGFLIEKPLDVSLDGAAP